MSKQLLVWMVMMSWAAAASAQWDHVIQLTHDNTTDNGGTQMVVDSAWRLHVFWVKSTRPPTPQASWLYYQRFDNWGNPLCEPRVLWPDSFWLDSPAGVFLDRNQVIHVMWGREADHPFREWTLYARLNTGGEFLTEPYEIETHMGRNGPFMVQGTTGNIWVVALSEVMVLSEDGAVVQPPRHVLEGPGVVLRMLPASDPAGHVWAAINWFPPEAVNAQVSVARLDTSVVTFETVRECHGAPGEAVSAESFFIDSTGVQHYIMYQDGVGDFYERYPRDGSPPDTVVFDPSPYGFGGAPLTFANDTLHWVYVQSNPDGFVRVGFDLSGHMILSPVFYPVLIGLTFNSVVRGHSLWLAGDGGSATTAQAVMLHISGPGEPPSAVEQHSDPLPRRIEFSCYPNPFNPTTTIRFDLLKRVQVKLDLFDVQGRLVKTLCDEVREAGRNELAFNGEGLASGVYFVRMKAGGAARTEKVLLLR